MAASHYLPDVEIDGVIKLWAYCIEFDVLYDVHEQTTYDFKRVPYSLYYTALAYSLQYILCEVVTVYS